MMVQSLPAAARTALTARGRALVLSAHAAAMPHELPSSLLLLAAQTRARSRGLRVAFAVSGARGANYSLSHRLRRRVCVGVFVYECERV